MLAQVCQESVHCEKSPPTLLKTQLDLCEIDSAQRQCAKLLKENPHLQGKIKSCSPKGFCQDMVSSVRDRDAACLKGYGQAIYETGAAVVDIAKSAAQFANQRWQGFKENVTARNQFVENCQKSISCKRALAQTDPRYAHLSDVELEKFSAAFLYVQASEMKNHQAGLQRHSHRAPSPRNSSTERTGQPTTELSPYFLAIWESTKDKISNTYDKYQCFTPTAQAEFECYALGLATDPALILGYFKKARFSSAIDTKADSAKAAKTTLPKSLTRSELKSKYLFYSPTSEKENLAWIQLAEAPPKNHVFVDIENSQLKKLNDTLKDKNFVTAATNYHKEITHQKMMALKESNPGLEITPYSDFKSLRYAFSGKLPADLETQVAKAFSEANQEFADSLRSSKLTRIEDRSEDWFRAGIGESADQANLAARHSRQKSENSLQSFTSQDTKNHLQMELSQTQASLSAIRSEFAKTSVIDGNTLHADAFDIVRKNKNSPAQLEAELKSRFGLQSLPVNSSQKMVDYINRVDGFSPGIYTAKREVATFNEAPFGGLSADVIGLGADNMKGTAEALAKSKSLDEALVESRRAERAVTQQFNEQKQHFSKALNSVLPPSTLKTICSGDDCIAVPTRALSSQEKQALVENLSQNGYAGRYRLAFVNEGVRDSADRNILATHGESIEKKLRKQLSATIDSRKLKGITFGIDMKTQKLNTGSVELILGTDKNLKLSPTEKELIQREFRRSLDEFNQELKKQQGIPGSYQGAVFFPKKSAIASFG